MLRHTDTMLDEVIVAGLILVTLIVEVTPAGLLSGIGLTVLFEKVYGRRAGVPGVPVPVSVTLEPEQTVAGDGEMLTEGSPFTPTVTRAVLVQPVPPVPVTVYWVVTAGEAVTEEPVVVFRPVPGLQT